MKSLEHILKESLRIGINDMPYTASPESWDELRQIIEERYEKLGPGTAETSIDFNDIDISEMTTFYDKTKDRGIFEETKFEYIDVSEWDVSHAESTECMFFECENLKSTGDLSNWNISNNKSLNRMFTHCNCLEYIGDISNWNVSNVKDINFMFYKCYNLRSVGDLSNWDVSNVENMDRIFSYSDITNIPKWYKI